MTYLEIETHQIKTECNTSTELPPEECSVIHGSEDLADENFVITDEDAIWDLPTDTANRPQMDLIKKQLEMLGEHHSLIFRAFPHEFACRKA